MTVPGTDPNFPPFGVGTGDSPLAVAGAAFEAREQMPIAVRTQTDPRFSRRELKSNCQGLGWTIDDMAAFEETPAAAISPASYPDTSPLVDDRAGSAVTPPDDAANAAPYVTQ
ncbi:MAG TPA: hypothetical protein VG815_19030 [Chloroflexota bacterium]|nr:hypothetical protein [Chloroflexota bacterium]